MKSKSRVLVVDDVPENIQILLNSIKDDFIVTAATNGEKALEIANKEPLPDLIILDILMPDMNGYEVCKKLKNSELTKDIPVIFISVLDDIEAILNGFEVGGVDYISKPFDIQEVLTRIKTHLELASQRKILKEKLAAEHIERVKQEDMMVQQGKMAAMGEMLALITHQWRQPLNSMSSVVATIKIENILEEKSMPKEDLVSYMNQLEETIKYLSETITDFSNFFKSTKSKQKINLRDIIKKSANLLGEMLKKESILLDYNECYYKDNISIYANELTQVILNIIKNSIDAAIENKTINSEIVIKSDENENEQIILIQDNNGGITENLLEHIFESDFTTKPNDKGTGLGLYMSKIIVEEHCRGKIVAKNSNGGMLFTIYIPKEEQTICKLSV